ncbi:MAG TPA: helix-turn-helix domain-containing protein [Polyangiaceae bacterium]|nr:helix-turn-helix domain-containing protein [Polyangiaceae bacterium]
MTSLRSYEDPCGIARALDVVGERWGLLIVRELVFGPKRFTDLRTGLRGASPNVLSQRLRELEAAGVVQKRADTAGTYELSDWGRELHPILVALGRWGAQSPVRPAGELSVDALIIALETTFEPNESWTDRYVFELRLSGDSFILEVEGPNLTITRGTPGHPNAQILSDPATLRAVVFGGRSTALGGIELRGDRRLAKRLLRQFPRPNMIQR